MTTDDFVDLNVPGLLLRYSNPSDHWHEIVLAFAATRLHVFQKYDLISQDASALRGPIEEAVVRFSDYTPLGQKFVMSGAVDKWLASCDRKRNKDAYRDPGPLERRVQRFLSTIG